MRARTEKSARLYREVWRLYLAPREQGEMPTANEVAEELGITVANVAQRSCRLLKDKSLMEWGPRACECDAHGPCLQHMKARAG